MTGELLIGAATAFWLGLLTSISPCPLATNIAAVSYVGRRIEVPGRVLAAGGLYTLGRALVYTAIGILLVTSLLSAPGISMFLQRSMNKILGPVLILAGAFLLEVFRPAGAKAGFGEGMQRRVDRMGAWGALLLGALFALSFCPVSAALFFGSLLPLALHHKSGVLLPAVYGIATGVPVLAFALLLATGARQVGKAFNALTAFERWARRITGGVFVLVGIYLTLKYVIGVDV